AGRRRRQHRRSQGGDGRPGSRRARRAEGRGRGEEVMSGVATSMKVMDVPQPGGPEALVLVERPVPQPRAGEVLIKVAAAGLNRADVLQRRGFYPTPPGAPSHPGLEVAGTIAAVGADVAEFKVGDAVCALLQGGGYAEYCSVAAGQVLPIPGSLD